MEDGQTIESLRKEVSAANTTRDAALDKEVAAKELIGRLQEEIERLRAHTADLQNVVAHLSEEPQPPVQRRPILDAAAATMLDFETWKSDPTAVGKTPGKRRPRPGSTPYALTPSMSSPGFMGSHRDDSTVSSLPLPSELPTALGRIEAAMRRSEMGPERLPSLPASRDPFDRVPPTAGAQQRGGSLWDE